ncbi:NAD-dependent aldehyde dehydrogenase [Rhizobium leguminosarum bv. trifolii WSM597]|uniref:NAD-dependent aldehyde dehydrogenase n=1 Tax=Rhizobium leguminosarum bv. trifolii WSM597 TaxID=754764 RepID=I9XD79_RHILT|nr:aldehyde dehydrogenase family protein [Rhizobium leguminosarum]EJB07026.1 NAD-dependent aldehyde dehydrogenase [Rhizobium leguminosarum bv. trifolii WSM597]
MNKDIATYFARYDVPSEVTSFVDRPIGHHVGGREIFTGKGEIDLLEPFTRSRLTGIANGTEADVDLAVAAARSALNGPWGRMPPLERQRLMLRLAEAMRSEAVLLAHLEAIDVGKSISEAGSIDVAGAIANLEYFAGWTSKIDGRTTNAVALPGETLTYTVKEPVGVVAAIIPWNFPLQILSWKLAAALACGCTVICKPSELTPLSAMRVAQLAAQVGFPEGVVNVVNGIGHVIGQALAAHKGIDKLSFTGSTPVGKAVGKTSLDTVKRLTLELGGKSPVIVTAKANLENAASAILAGVFLNSGQVCDAGSRVYAHRSVHAELLQRLKAGAEQLPIGAGLDPASRITPLVSSAHRNRVLNHIGSAISEGAHPVTGEESGTVDRDDWVLRPTIFDDCRDNMRIFREEIFGPVLGVSQFDDMDDAVDRANSGEFGLAAAVYSDNVNETIRLSRRLKAGNIYINAHGLLDPAMPFGGLGASGFGKDMGPEQLDGFLATKSIYVQIAGDPPLDEDHMEKAR